MLLSAYFLRRVLTFSAKRSILEYVYRLIVDKILPKYIFLYWKLQRKIYIQKYINASRTLYK